MNQLSTGNIEITEGLIEAMEDHIDFACCAKCNTYMLESECVRGGQFGNAYCPSCAKSLDLTEVQLKALWAIAKTMSGESFDTLINMLEAQGFESLVNNLERQTEMLQKVYDLEPNTLNRSDIQDLWLRNDAYIDFLGEIKELGIISTIPEFCELMAYAEEGKAQDKADMDK